MVLSCLWSLVEGTSCGLKVNSVRGSLTRAERVWASQAAPVGLNTRVHQGLWCSQGRTHSEGPRDVWRSRSPVGWLSPGVTCMSVKRACVLASLHRKVWGWV